MGLKAYRFVGLNKDVWLPDDIKVEIDIVPSWRTNVRSNQKFSGQTSYTQHETANFNSGANARMHRNWLHGGASGSSVGFNFVVDDGVIIQLTPLDEVTWAAGTPEGNKYSWHTELCVNSDINHTKARRNAAALAGAILAAKGWGTNKLYQHNIWWGKDCPYLLRREGRWAPFVSQVDDFRKAALSPSTPAPKPEYDKPVPILALQDFDESNAPLVVELGDGNPLYWTGYRVKAVRETPRLKFAYASSPHIGPPIKKGEEFTINWVLQAADGEYYAVTPWWTRVKIDDVVRV